MHGSGSPSSPTCDASTQPCKPEAAQNVSSNMKEALERYKETETILQARLLELYQAVEKERVELQASRVALEQEKAEFEAEKSRVQHILQDNEQVILNVGGSLFTTTVTTLRNAPAPSLFSAMFSGRHCLKRDDKGTIFIDRDGRHFHMVLNYLRDGNLAYPSEGNDYQYLLELRAEAEYYGLVGMMSLIDRYPFGSTTVTRAATVNQEDSWMYEDGQDEIVMTVDKSCQLLGVGLCGTDGSYTAELKIFEVEAEDYGSEVSQLQSAAQSFTKADGQIVKLMLPAPVHLQPEKFYMLSVTIQGTDSYCCEDCMEDVIAGGVKVRFHSWESPNGTNEQRGQFPQVYIRSLAQQALL